MCGDERGRERTGARLSGLFLGAVCARCGQRCVTDVVCVWVVVDGAVSKSVGARYDAAQLRVKPRGSLNVAMPDGADFVRGSTVILEDGTEHRTTLDAEAYDAMSAAGNELDWFGKVPGLDEAKIEILFMSGKSLIDMRDAIDSGRHAQHGSGQPMRHAHRAEPCITAAATSGRAAACIVSTHLAAPE